MCAKWLQLCPTLCNPTDCCPQGFSVQGIFQVSTLEWVAMPSSRGSSWPRDWTCFFCDSFIAGRFFITEPPGKPIRMCRKGKSCGETFLFLPSLHILEESAPGDNERFSASSNHTGFLKWVPEELNITTCSICNDGWRRRQTGDNRILGTVIFILMNQTGVNLPVCSKVNLLTLGWGEGKCSVYCKAKKIVWAANALKTWSPLKDIQNLLLRFEGNPGAQPSGPHCSWNLWVVSTSKTP